MTIFSLLFSALIALQPQPRQLKADNPAAVPVARTDEGWVTRNEGFNARAVQGHEKGDINIIFLGDSITQGWGGAGHAVWEQRYAPLHAVNFGIGGDRTQHVLFRIEHGNLDGLADPVAGSPPRLVILMIGTNNTGSDSAEHIAGGVRAVIDGLHAKLPGTPVLLLAVFPRGEKPTDPFRVKVDEINRLLSHFTDPLVTYLDLGPAFLTASAKALPSDAHGTPFAELVAWLNTGEPMPLDPGTAAALGCRDSKTPLVGKGFAQGVPDNSFRALAVTVDHRVHVLFTVESIFGSTTFTTTESGEFEKIVQGGPRGERFEGAKDSFVEVGRRRLQSEYRARLLSKEIMPDFLHLSAEGYRVWADTMAPVLKRLLGEQPAK